MLIGYGLTTKGEADRYMEATLKEFDRLCDHTVILGNNAGKKERELVEKYGFDWVEDNREWGKEQWKIKQDFVKDHVAPLNPSATVCLDMDEVFHPSVDRESIDLWMKKGQAWHVFIVNLWDNGYRLDVSFWNVRIWGWKWREKLGDSFFNWEKKPVHCGLAPKWAYALNLHAPFTLFHYGLKEKADRERKIARYEQYDPNRAYITSSTFYDTLKKPASHNFDGDTLAREVEKEVSGMRQPLNKQLIMEKKRKEYLVKRLADGEIIGVKENVLDNVLKQQYKGMGFELISDTPIGEQRKKEEVSQEKIEDETVCDQCGFKAKSAFGLRSHQRKHE